MLILCSCLGCAIEPQFGPQTLYLDATVQRTAIRQSIVPENRPSFPMKAIIYPFWVEQDFDLDSLQKISVESTRAFWMVWSENRLFSTFHFSEQAIPLGTSWPESAGTNYDLVIIGRISQLFFGGNQGTTTLSLHVEIFDAKTGLRIWTMDHAGTIQGDFDKDYLLFRKRQRMPLDPYAAILTTLAKDMAQPIREWTSPRTPRPVIPQTPPENNLDSGS